MNPAVILGGCYRYRDGYGEKTSGAGRRCLCRSGRGSRLWVVPASGRNPRCVRAVGSPGLTADMAKRQRFYRV